MGILKGYVLKNIAVNTDGTLELWVQGGTIKITDKERCAEIMKWFNEGKRCGYPVLHYVQYKIEGGA
jgi:hypothetical protein